MGFNVGFKIKHRNGTVVSNGILVYETTLDKQRGRSLSPDYLNQKGEADTTWHSDWLNETIDVYCHTDGKNQGRPAFVGRVTLKAKAYYDLSVR